ncbi:MAG TPA: 3-oxoacyl-[acyl-carrier-protein] synthase III C-terminal domain-containing protein [Anaerolineales bacterium]|nr:3-oxoacyl-[acyl-carrier-protein] synthase III C-terminal domain-containing protein [Anaerolineales bacterium]
MFRFATRILGKALKQAIQQAGLTTDDIDLFIPHQANRRIIESAARYVGLPEEKVFINIDRYGNTSAASIPIALTEAIEQGRARPGDTLAFVAFGAGLTWAASVVKLGSPVQPLPVDRAWLKRLAWNPLGAVAAGLGRAVGAITGSVARLVGWVRQG